jgi:ribonuclease HI/probable phosphoglycerate mutase
MRLPEFPTLRPRLRPERKTTSPPKRTIFYADGAIQPKRTGVSVVGVGDEGQVVVLANRTLPPMTNNEAEYQALLMLLELAKPYAALPVQVRMDSEIVIYQMKGRFSVNSPALKLLHREACARLPTFAALSFAHVPREQNRLADALASDASFGRGWKLGSNEG